MMEKLSLSAKKLSLFFLLLLFLFSSCTHSPPLSAYRDTAFCADLVYFRQNIRICAFAQVAAPREESDSLPRDVTLSFREPEALHGLTVTRKNGDIFYEYKGLSMSTDATELLRCIDLLLIEEHKNTEDQSYDIRLSSDTGFPEEIVTSEETLQIQNFQKISSNE